MWRVGEVAEVSLQNGSLAYVQYIGTGTHGNGSTVIRVLDGEFDRTLEPSEIQDLVAQDDRYRIYSTLPYGELHPRLKRRGPFAIPTDRPVSPVIRNMLRPSERNPDGWSIIDADGVKWTGKEFAVRHPEVDQRRLSVATIFGHAATIRMLDESWDPARASYDSIY
jgi:hypothetical protein